MNIPSPRFFFLLLLASFFLASFALEATLSKDEVEALKDIAKTLGKEDWVWDFSCRERNRPSDRELQGSVNITICNCNGTVCHVTNILLKQQNLPGTLPQEFIRLPYLQEIDLTRNYLSGGIPEIWGSLNLVNISVVGNRLTGSIPREIAKISTLQNFAVEANQLSGNLPPELGNLFQIQKLQLSSNNFTGEMPPTFAKLASLRDIRIADNQFSGKIPDFIQNWTSLQKLVIEGSGLSGPIPSGISLLQNLTALRISDLSGYEYSPFPQLNNSLSMQYLILRNCNINGTLPEYLGTMTQLKNVDLSLNNLSGPIPSYFYGRTGVYIDISYNNFNIESHGCQDENVNLFDSSLTPNNSGILSCLRSFDCHETSYSLHINCGGGRVTVNRSTYDDDSEEAGEARFLRSGTGNWAFKSTGKFMDSNEKHDYYISSNESKLSITNAELYTNARVSPISLTYYGFCLENGNYTVNLHFAEIMFTDDQTFNSLGRRVFDIYIQGKLVQKDFNIAKEAGGVGKAITKPFTAVVTNRTLEIRLYWAGKGTTSLPRRSVYGPLISAISVKSDFKPPSKSSISAGAVVGIVVAVAVIVVLVFGILWWKGCLGKKNSLAKEIKGLDLQTGLFTLRQIKAATNDFDIANKIGEGGFGPVYKGVLSDGAMIAVKQLSSKSRQGNREFLNEIGMISALQHPHLVKLYGCCVEGDQLLLVYEYMENNSLAHALFDKGQEEPQIKLDWATRHRICVGIARGLAFLHEESRLKIVHRDIKATNVLLDKDLNPKISDFGMAKLDEEDNTHISTRIAGTYGYMAPGYAMHGYLTDKADVYSFGIVALEIISGRNNTTQRQKEALYLLDWAHLLKEKGNLMELVDRRLGSDFNKEEVMVMINVALMCTNVSPTLRPTMSSVVSMLEGRTVVQEVVSESSEVLDEKKMEAMRQYYYQDHSSSMEGPWTASPTSATDLYPVHLDSSYWEKRD